MRGLSHYHCGDDGKRRAGDAGGENTTVVEHAAARAAPRTPTFANITAVRRLKADLETGLSLTSHDDGTSDHLWDIRNSRRRARLWLKPSLRIAPKICGKIEIICWLIVGTISSALVAPLQEWLGPRIAAAMMVSLQTFAVIVGGAMIGATAMVSSFVLFAMQVNVERLPYRLFSRFSSDPKLLLPEKQNVRS